MRDLLTRTCSEMQAKGYNYGFVEYDDPGAADRAMATLNGRRVHQSVCFFLNLTLLPWFSSY